MARRIDGAQRVYTGRRVPIDKLLELWDTTNMSIEDIAKDLGFTREILRIKLREAWELGDVRVARGNARRAKS